MIVDVLYEGLTLAKGANARPATDGGEGLFVELESPMPVGTALTLRTPDGDRAARVEQVNEGVGPGVLVRFASAVKAPAPVAAEAHEAKNGGGDDDEPHDPKKSGDDDEPHDPKKSGRQRKKSRKIVIGH